jgi:hypothetical protein
MAISSINSANSPLPQPPSSSDPNVKLDQFWANYWQQQLNSAKTNVGNDQAAVQNSQRQLNQLEWTLGGWTLLLQNPGAWVTQHTALQNSLQQQQGMLASDQSQATFDEQTRAYWQHKADAQALNDDAQYFQELTDYWQQQQLQDASEVKRFVFSSPGKFDLDREVLSEPFQVIKPVSANGPIRAYLQQAYEDNLLHDNEMIKFYNNVIAVIDSNPGASPLAAPIQRAQLATWEAQKQVDVDLVNGASVQQVDADRQAVAIAKAQWDALPTP